ncbi:MAG: ankyrin repeat domain-containing protein, partial [Pyrinomonadaceae bacterium]
MTCRRILLLFALLTLPVAAARAQDLNQELWEAARKGDAAAVRALLDKGADVNAKFRYNATALSYAADKGHTEVVKILIERGADVNVRDTFYQATPLSWATGKGHVAIIQALLD